MVFPINTAPRHIPELRVEIPEDFPLGLDNVLIYRNIGLFVWLMKGCRKIIFRRIKFNFSAEQEILKKRHSIPPETVEFAYEYFLDKILLVYGLIIRNSFLRVKEI